MSVRLVMLLIAAGSIAASRPALALPRPEQELVALEQAYANALIRKDIPFLVRYYAEDWRGGDWMGFATKSNIIRILRDGSYNVRSMRLRDVRVRIKGSIAIVQGMDDEVSAAAGKDVSGTWLFTDIFERRAGRWLCINSHTTKLERK
jgi:ketosteroid isomerase-like protein